jgi:hypothetical protein
MVQTGKFKINPDFRGYIKMDKLKKIFFKNDMDINRTFNNSIVNYIMIK